MDTSNNSSGSKNATNEVSGISQADVWKQRCTSGDNKHVLVLPIYKKRHLKMKPIFNQSFRVYVNHLFLSFFFGGGCFLQTYQKGKTCGNS